MAGRMNLDTYILCLLFISVHIVFLGLVL